MKHTIRILSVFLIAVLVSCSKKKLPVASDQTPELLKLADELVSDMNVKSLEKAHSHSSIHSEIQLTADVDVTFDSADDAQRIANGVRTVFESNSYKTLVFNDQSQGFDRAPGVKHIGAGGWSNSGSSHFDSSLGIDRHCGSTGGSGDVFIRERLRISGVFLKGNHRVVFHLWLFPEEGRCYASFSIINNG